MTQVSRAVLITGCSSGIGLATARHLIDRGWTVYPTARRPESVSGLDALPLDVTDEESMRSAVEKIEAEHGAVGGLVNNAGYSVQGPVEQVPIEEVRRQFETNFFGLLRLTQLVLPGMRRQGWGRIVNISSMGGRMTLPGGGFYHGTKYAVEALSDALRFEVRGFGVKVSVVEPGLILTGFGETATANLHGEGPYEGFARKLEKKLRSAYSGGLLSRFGSSPEKVARVIDRALSSDRPSARYVVGLDARAMITIRRLLPDRAWDAFLRTQFPRPGR